MTGETIECPNCGRSNPSWAQVCRTCGFALGREGARRDPATSGGVASRLPTDQASLLSVGAAVGSILVAIALGLAFSALNPTPPTLGAGSSSSPSARPTTGATVRPNPSGSGSGPASASAIPKPIATITFGAGLNTATREVTSPTTTFGPTGYFAHSISSAQPFGVSSLVEEVVRVANGKETVVQSRTDPRSVIPAKPDGKVAGFIVTTRSLLDEWAGGGTFILRVYRGNEKLGEGRFTLAAT